MILYNTYGLLRDNILLIIININSRCSYYCTAQYAYNSHSIEGRGGLYECNYYYYFAISVHNYPMYIIGPIQCRLAVVINTWRLSGRSLSKTDSVIRQLLYQVPMLTTGKKK